MPGEDNMMLKFANKAHGSLLGFVVVGLLEQEVRSQLLILVACKIGLDDLVTGETESAESFDSITFFFCDRDLGGSGRQGSAFTALALDILRDLSV
jgi:hypothetical protein